MKGLLGILLSVLTFSLIAVGGAINRRRRREARRALTKVPEVQIAGVKDGDNVRIKGVALARAPLRTSPLSQRRCIAYRLVVERYDEGVDNWWERVLEDDAFDDIVLADSTGEAVLHAPFEIKLDPYDANTVEYPPPALADLLERDGVPFDKGPPGAARRLRYVEHVLLAGEEIMAVGRATILVDPAGRAPSLREPPVMCHLKGEDRAVIIAEADGISAWGEETEDSD